jgi:hypothetical protein
MVKKIVLIVFVFLALGTRAQELINSSNVAAFTTAGQGDLYVDENDVYYLGLDDGSLKEIGIVTERGDSTGDILSWNDTTEQWEPRSSAAFDGWGLNGNNNTSASNFLGTTNDIKMVLRSNNTTMMEFGRRQTLSLYDASATGLFPYNQANGSVVYVRGNSGVSSLQFEASSASFYKPVFFTDDEGNFVMRGSAAGTDFFELGSAGTNNDGSLIFSIGDDGDEPMIFQKYNYTSQSYVEMLRLQGTGLNTTVRAGIGVDGNTPNSTLQVNGSISRAVEAISSPTTLDDSHHTIILSNNSAITLPSATTAEGREYVIKKTNDGNSTISAYLDEKGISRTSISRGTYTFLSDGSNWQLLNSKTIDSYSGSFTITTTGSLSIAGIPFRPSRIVFTAYANVDATTLNSDNGVGNNNSGINNSFGYMTGFAQSFNGTTTQQVICGGGSGNSINDISRYASNSQCIGIRYGNQNGDNLGLTTASLTSFNNNGFTLNVLSNADDVVVVYTAYR